jgi:hypothetical protein
MKKLLVIVFLLFSQPAFATYFTLVSCEYKYIPEYQESLYVGLYRSEFGNYFTAYFTSYCPASISQ